MNTGQYLGLLEKLDGVIAAIEKVDNTLVAILSELEPSRRAVVRIDTRLRVAGMGLEADQGSMGDQSGNNQ